MTLWEEKGRDPGQRSTDKEMLQPMELFHARRLLYIKGWRL